MQLVLLFFLSVFFPFHPVVSAAAEPLLINQIAIDPKDHHILYAAARPQGVLKSTDQGMTWQPVRQGLMNTSVYYIVINPADPKILYLGTFGGGIYKSEDAGGHWTEANTGLNNTNIHALVLNPSRPDQLLVSTSTGELFKTENGGKDWSPFGEGLPSIPDEVYASFLVFPHEPAGIYLAQGGIFQRTFASPRWQAMEQNLSEQVITALAYDPAHKTLYAGTQKEGLFAKILSSPPVSDGRRSDWSPVAGPFSKQWIRFIIVDSADPSILYVAVINQGLFKSTDRGATWREIDTGLPKQEVESLVIDPATPTFLYAGTHNSGLFLSRNGGLTWSAPARIEVEPVKQIIASLSGQERLRPSHDPRLVPPPAFAKCNQCHGWTDPVVNQKLTIWRVSPNRRDWRPTVQRMSPGAGLNPTEEEEIITFLTAYGNRDRPAPP